MYKEGNRFKEPFEISTDADYYVKVYRDGNEATKYGFSIHPSLENGLVQNSDRELNDHFVMAAPITLNEAMKDINGSLNMSRTQENSLKNTDNEDYYIMDFSKAGTYAFYINLYSGTHHNVSFYTKIEIFNANGASEHQFGAKIYKSGQYYASTFTIGTPGKYYIRISRANNEATKYGFSVHPSVANGLVQNSDRELNDFMSMAAPIDWTEIGNGISGNVNVTRESTDSSIRNTDYVDYYAIDFDQIGSHTLDFNLTAGTVSNVSHSVDLKLRNSVGTIVEELPKLLYQSGQNLNQSFNIPATGIYYLSIYRENEATEYTYTIVKP